jgi:hypothetical protein
MIPEPFTLERPAVDWTRHARTQAPKILPPPGEVWRTPSGRKQTGRYYTRTTTLAKTLEDAHALYGWKARRAVLGAGRRPDLMNLAASLTAEDHDRDALDELAERLIEASGPSAAAIGTALHGFTERLDRGEPLDYVPEAFVELVAAWQRITAPLRLEYREVRTVHDRLGAAGTPDAFGFCSLPDPDGVVDERRVIDLKSGKIKYPATMSGQLYIYADSELYDPETGERRPLEVNRRWGLIAHLQSDGSEPPGLYWLNLEHGRRLVELAVPVREWRAVKAEAILRPALVEERAPATPAPGDELVDITEALEVAPAPVVPSSTRSPPASPPPPRPARSRSCGSSTSTSGPPRTTSSPPPAGPSSTSSSASSARTPPSPRRSRPRPTCTCCATSGPSIATSGPTSITTSPRGGTPSSRGRSRNTTDHDTPRHPHRSQDVGRNGYGKPHPGHPP